MEKQIKKVLIITAIALAVIAIDCLVSALLSREKDPWRDYYGDDEIYNIELTREIEDFPGTKFVWDATSVGVKETNGVNTFIYGYPVWNVFFYDITGDGFDDICTTVSVEEDDVVSDRIVIHDYQNNMGYELSDPGNFNLRLKEKNGELIAIKTGVSDENSVEGKIVFNGVYMTFEETK